MKSHTQHFSLYPYLPHNQKPVAKVSVLNIHVKGRVGCENRNKIVGKKTKMFLTCIFWDQKEMLIFRFRIVSISVFFYQIFPQIMVTVVSYPVTTNLFTSIDFNYLLSQRIDMHASQCAMSTAFA